MYSTTNKRTFIDGWSVDLWIPEPLSHWKAMESGQTQVEIRRSNEYLGLYSDIDIFVVVV